MKMEVSIPSVSLCDLEPGETFQLPDSSGHIYLTTANRTPPTVLVVRLEDGFVSQLLGSVRVDRLPVKCVYDD